MDDKAPFDVGIQMAEPLNVIHKMFFGGVHAELNGGFETQEIHSFGIRTQPC
jgi:hypothetical protein